MPRAPDPTADERPPAADAPPVPRPVAESLALWVVLARAARTMHEVAAAQESKHGLTGAEFGALEALYHKGPLLVGDLQRLILVSSGGATYVVDRLERRGLVERRENPGDRRARYAALTPAGTELMHEIFPEHASVIHAALQGVSAGDRRMLRELLKRLGLEAQRYLEERTDAEGGEAAPGR